MFLIVIELDLISGNMIWKLILFSLITIFIGSCVKEKEDQTILMSTDRDTFCLKNILYKDDMMLDIYSPTKYQFFFSPVIIFIHGGGWIKGDKSSLESGKMGIIDSLRSLGYFIVSINYSLCNEEVDNQFPKNIVDCKDAVRWVRKNAPNFMFDVNSIGVWGGSAGGHLSLMLGLSDDQEFLGDKRLNQYSSAVNYIIDFYGPANLMELFYLNPPMSRLNILKDTSMVKYNQLATRVEYLFGLSIETEITQVSSLCLQYNPIARVQNKAYRKPILIMHGDQDFTVPVQQSRAMVDSLVKYEYPVQYIEMLGLGHNFKYKNDQDEQLIRNEFIRFVLEASY